MDRGTYSEPEVVELINRHFIPIRVDNDKRPDINHRYNMGGWPTTAIMTPEGKIIFGGTYFQPEQMKSILKRVMEAWSKDRNKIIENAVELSSLSEKHLIDASTQPAPHPITADVIIEAMGLVVNSFDSLYGGFGFQTKFPHTHALHLTLNKYCATGNTEFFKMFTKTLDAMAGGGLWDKEEGGFFRYSTTRDWSIPHYEKMCEDNARLLELYLSAYDLTNNMNYHETVNAIITYVKQNLWDPASKGFYGSQDADEEYYKLTRASRQTMKPPSVDKTVYVNWSARMASAFLHASFTMNDPSLLEVAVANAEMLISRCFTSDQGLHHYVSEGSIHEPGLLTDYAPTLDLLLNTYQATGSPHYLAAAERIAQDMITRFDDAVNGGFYDRISTSDDSGGLKIGLKPLVENSEVAEASLKLYDLTKMSQYFSRGEAALRYLQPFYSDYGMMMAPYALAVEAYLNFPIHIQIIGDLARTETQKLIEEAFRSYHPNRLIQPMDSQRDADLISELGFPILGEPAAYVCMGNICLEPVRDKDNLAETIRALRGKKIPRAY